MQNTGGGTPIGTRPNRNKPEHPDYGPGQGPFGAILGATRTNIPPASSSNAKKRYPHLPVSPLQGGGCHFEKPRTGLHLNRKT